MWCLLTLPLALLALPFLLLRFMVRALFGLIMLPIVLLVAVVVSFAVAFAFAMAVLLPLAPFLLIGAIVWAVTRNSRGAIAARG